MSRKFNFNPGPSTLPLSVLEKVRDEFVDYKGKGFSLIEASHRGKDYEDVHNTAITLMKSMLKLPDNYKVLFLGGGATFQFSMIPHNFLSKDKSCDFLVTGEWSKKAQADAKKLGKVNLVYDGAADKYTKLPSVSSLKFDSNAAYVHMTSNETIHGNQWNEWPDTGKVPLIVDMSSDIMSRRIPVEKMAMIYAGAQKNLGPAGAAVVIIRDDMLTKCPDSVTAYLNYKLHADNNSLYNTPPVFSIYVIKLVMEWLNEKGGLTAMEKEVDQKAANIYAAIDSSGGFYTCPVAKNCRSKMNVVYKLPNEELEKQFLDQATAQGMIGLKGHRALGGCRASLYNALPLEATVALANFMNDFAKKHG